MKSLAEKTLEWALGNQSAAEFLSLIGAVSQEADDIHDDDGGDISQVVAGLLSATAFNPFFAQHREVLGGVMMASLVMWGASNRFAVSENETTRMYGFVYREVLEQIIPLVSMLCGAGIRQAQEIAVDGHEYYHVRMEQDSFAQWQKEVTDGQL